MNRLLFLKISWRPESELEGLRIATEVERYNDLYAAEVPNILQLVCGADTKHNPSEVSRPDLRLHTRTQERLGIPKLHKRIQTRLVFETLGIPLSEYKKSTDLIAVLYQVLLGKSYAS